MAGFVKGQAKPANSGRQKGTPNKKRLKRVAEALAEKDLDPIDKILAEIPFLEPRYKVQTWLEILSYCQAKPKDLEPAGDETQEGEDLKEQLKEVSDAKLIALVKSDKGTA